MSTLEQRGGFSLIEVIVGLMIFTFGVLALASATAFFFTQIRVSDVDADRTMAVQAAVESIRSKPFDSLSSVPQAYATNHGGYHTWYSVSTVSGSLRNITVYSRGRGYSPGTGWSDAVVDSFAISVTRNMQQR